MESDEVDSAAETAKLFGEFFDMVGGVVKAFEDDIFEEDAALSAPVVLTNCVDDFSDRICFFYWHNLHSLIMERRVETDSEVAF